METTTKTTLLSSLSNVVKEKKEKSENVVGDEDAHDITIWSQLSASRLTSTFIEKITDNPLDVDTWYALIKKANEMDNECKKLMETSISSSSSNEHGNNNNNNNNNNDDTINKR